MAGLVARAADWAENLHIRAWRRLGSAISRDCHAVGCALRAAPPPRLSQAAYRGRLQQRGGREAQRLLPGLFQLRAAAANAKA